MKGCNKCGFSKQTTDFYVRKSGERAGQYYEKCKECYKSRGRSYYGQNKEKQLALAKLRKLRYIDERKKFLEEIKNQPCLDCKKKYPVWVMDFDHRNACEKIDSVSKLAFRKITSIQKIKDEIEKCDLVCANCHRQRTYDRMQKVPAEIAKLVKARV